MRTAAVRTQTDPKAAEMPGSELLEQVRNIFLRLKQLQNTKDSNDQSEIVGQMSTAIGVLRKATQKGVFGSKLTDRSIEEKLQEAFRKKYNVSVYQTSRVTYTLPAGHSVYDMLVEAHAVSLITRGIVAVYPTRLDKWRTRPEFSRRSQSESDSVTVEAILPHSGNKTRPEQEVLIQERGYIQATAPELAAAHAAFFALFGKDLFEGNIVRVMGTKLYYGSGGLSEMDENEYINNCRYQNVRTAVVHSQNPSAKAA